MPFIHVRSLPLPGSPDVRSILEGVSRDFAEGTGVGIEHVTATWTILDPGHYAAGGEAASIQPAESHPLLVDLVAPDFHGEGGVAKMLAVVARSLAARAGVSPGNVFIEAREARSGRVYDAGRIVRW